MRDEPLADEDFTELVLGKGNARRTQLIENEGTNMCFCPAFFKVSGPERLKKTQTVELL